MDFNTLANHIKEWGQALGFQQIGITEPDLTRHEQYLKDWLEAGYHGTMSYLSNHGDKRSHPTALVPDTLRVISARMDYLPKNPSPHIARYALGRDYHKVMRSRLKKLADKISDKGYRVFVDSAPVLEKAIAEQAGLGWIGKHTNLINRKAGSWFFLGEIFVDIPLPVDQPATAHCGSCTACINICPTQAIVGPYQLDARRCIAYLTIEYKGSIPLELRPLMGNRIFGCDDCQLVCPWNRYAKATAEGDFRPRHKLDRAQLIDLFLWEETDFLKYTEGSAIRRAGYISWLRNIAVALGNAAYSVEIIEVLKKRAEHPSDLVREHVAWALQQQAASAES